jgi:serine/threonine protein kinase
MLARGPIGFDQATPILEGILSGLRASHERGVVHRDLKPENVWLLRTEDGQPAATAVKLLDFGLAKVVAGPDGSNVKMTRAGAPLGTPAYMSPEQCRGVQEVDARSDLYALGVILFQMFAGRVPFAGESYVDVINQHLTAEPPSLAALVGAPAGLETVIRTAMAKRREERFESAAAMRAALLACGAAGWVPRPSASTAPAATPPSVDPEDTTTVRPAAAPRAKLTPQTLEPTPVPRPRSTALDRSELFGELTVQSELRGSTLTVAFCGELDRDDAAELLAGFFTELTEAIDSRVDRVVVDVESLSFLNPGGFAQFAGWLASLKRLRERGLAPATVRYSSGVRWQATAIATLQRADGALNVEATD